MLRFMLLALVVAAGGCGGGDDDVVREGPPLLPEVPEDGAEPARPVLPLPRGIEAEDVGPGSDPVPEPAAPAPDVVDAGHLVGFGENGLRVFVLSVDEAYDDPSFLGVVVACRGDSVEATVAHGLFPGDSARRLRTSVAAGGVAAEPAFFGPARQAPPTPSVAHETVVAETADVERLARLAFVPGAVVSNGHTAFRNAVPAEHMEAALGEVLACPAFDS